MSSCVGGWPSLSLSPSLSLTLAVWVDAWRWCGPGIAEKSQRELTQANELLLEAKTKANAQEKEINKLQALLKERFENADDYMALLKRLSDQVRRQAMPQLGLRSLFSPILRTASFSFFQPVHGRGQCGDGRRVGLGRRRAAAATAAAARWRGWWWSAAAAPTAAARDGWAAPSSSAARNGRAAAATATAGHGRTAAATAARGRRQYGTTGARGLLWGGFAHWRLRGWWWW